nr:ABC transporter ATP-binding protein [Candidatus Njordarchaeum guaymaensis]
MGEHLLEIQDLKGYYRGIFGVVRAVDGVSLTVDSGEVVGLAGESGCGKSTLAQLCSGSPTPLLHYESGKILVDGSDINKISPEVLRTEVKCKRMSYIPQASMDSLNPVKRIRDFVMDVVRERTGKKPSKAEVLTMAGDHFEKLGLERRVLDRYPHELSGGMKQRVVIGISTLWNPKLLIIDEPTSALDVTTQRLVIISLVSLKKAGIIKSMLFVSHDITVLGQLCDRCAVMYGGKIVEIGSMNGILDNSLHPYTSALISSVVSYDPERMGKGGLKSIPGSPPDLRDPPPGCRYHPRCEKCMDICRVKEPPLNAIENRRDVACWLY